MNIPSYGKAGKTALLIVALGLSGCVTDGYGSSYGSVSVGTGWYDGYYYPGYYGYPGYYDYGYWGYPHGYYRPNYKGHRHWKGHDGRPSGQWQGVPPDRSRPSGQWQGRPPALSRPDSVDRPRPSDGGQASRWQGRGGRNEREWTAPRAHVRERR